MEKPLSVVLAAVTKKQNDSESMLLIKREKEPFKGFWSLPGGKVEGNEHLSEAAVREVHEETKIQAQFVSHLGVVSEHLLEGETIVGNWMLHLCKLHPMTDEVTSGDEGHAQWFSFEEVRALKEKIIPSDFVMIEEMLIEGKTGYYDSKIAKDGEKHILKTFERLSS